MGKDLSLSVVSVKKIFKERIILNNVDIEFKKGKTYALMGASGIGKSTFMHIIAGFDRADFGEVLLNGTSISSLSFLRRTEKISFVVQEPIMISELSVYENLILPMQLLGIGQAEYKRRAENYLDAVGLL